MADLILGTAGHIDHGKTSLVKALTGIDCDRLPEEKERGITIDIGFAHLELGEYRLGIVDVPGHERFIRNMLAGATGIDLALLVVAADDSVMPQTREHLEILQLLGLQHGVIALTKSDLVDDTTREVAALEVRTLVQGTFLADAPIVATAVHTGIGLEELKQALAKACAKVAARQGSEWFRMAIDRAFVLQGHGTVVTGSVTSGSVRVGDELEWLPNCEKVRVRGLHQHDEPREEVHRGQRAAINLAGVPHETVHRGQELARPGYLLPSRVLTTRLRALSDNRRPLKHRTPLRLHVGTAEVFGTLSLLDCEAIEPGQWELAQLFLDEEVTAVWGQPFVVRDSSAEHTLGGGQVLQPVASKIRRMQQEVLEQVHRLWSNDPMTRAGAFAWFAGYHGFSMADLVRSAGVAPESAPGMVAELLAAGRLVELPAAQKTLLLERTRLQELEDRLLHALGKLHEENPLMTTHDRQKTLAQLAYIGEDPLLQALTDRLIAARKIVGDNRRIALGAFKPKLSVNQRKLKEKVVNAHQEAGFAPPQPESFAAMAGGIASSLKDIFEVACAEGLLVRITEDVFLHADFEAEMTRRVREKLGFANGLTVAEIRDLLGTTRKYAVPLCEYLDRIGVTRRQGDTRVLARRPEAPS